MQNRKFTYLPSIKELAVLLGAEWSKWRHARVLKASYVKKGRIFVHLMNAQGERQSFVVKL